MAIGLTSVRNVRQMSGRRGSMGPAASAGGISELGVVFGHRVSSVGPGPGSGPEAGSGVLVATEVSRGTSTEARRDGVPQFATMDQPTGGERRSSQIGGDLAGPSSLIRA